MSAITGIFYRDGRSVSLEQIKKMNDCLSHRGPDGSRLWCNGSIAFGHQMLHTTLESITEELPFEDPDSGLVITSDARIDNRKELALLLGLEDVQDIPDSYFILKAYHKWGEKCPEKLLGDFAFVIWDPVKEELFCARDHMGVKPLYYHLVDDIFVFATEMKALFTIPEISKEVNDIKLAFHIMNVREKKLTFYKGIFSLTAANFITVSLEKDQIQRYWKLDPNSQILMDSDNDYANAFRTLFDECVKCRLRSSFPIGFELSGGLDSSSIVSTAKKIYNDPGIKQYLDTLKTFSFVFDDFVDCDERFFIKKIVNTGGIEPHYIKGDNVNPLEQVETILWHLEQPFFNPNIAMLWKLYEKMHKNNIRIILSGQDGDSVISYGQNYLRDLAVSFRWNKLINEIKKTSHLNETSFLNIFLKQVAFPLIPQPLKNLLSSNKVHRKPGSFILNDEFRNRTKANEFLHDLYHKPVEEARTSKKFHYYLIDIYPHQYTLEFMDRSYAAFSIEPRYPFFDKRLIEFCYAIPTEMKLRNGWRRYILRIAMDGLLPKENQWRIRKPDLNPIFQKNLLRYEENYLKMLVSDKQMGIYVDLDKLQNILKNFKFKTEKYNFHSDSFDIWYITLIHIWLNENTKNI